ncbi:endonuclease V [Sungkyunkwania multivorans]|uniref:Endonuclease V n=1 Tax=Sungkyunkwania multivorans TaxID=1173618 RepID=A0ABW3CUI3_9FLAO
MVLSIDVHYKPTYAKAVGLLFRDWQDKEPTSVFSERINEVEPYIPGQFYQRELPCIMALLQKVDLKALAFILVDGFVFLDDVGKHGLGGHLYERLDKEIPIIGVAKTGFHSIKNSVQEITRGNSKTPLYVTAVGVDLAVAATYVLNMHGNHRIPTLLKEMDRLTKTE